jgi:uncharacterized membrane protein
MKIAMILYLIVAHVLGDVLLFGGLIAGRLWMQHAAAEKDVRVVAFVLRGIQKMNRWTLHLGGVVVLISGLWLALSEPTPLRLSANAWLLYSVILLFVVLILAMGIQAPIMKKLMKVVESGAADSAATFGRIARRWNLLSTINLLLMVVIVFMMVFQPGRSQ